MNEKPGRVTDMTFYKLYVNFILTQDENDQSHDIYTVDQFQQTITRLKDVKITIRQIKKIVNVFFSQF